MAGDTPEAAAVAGHLAGCPDCATRMSRLRRDATVIREVVRWLPPAGLRDRTLAYVGAVGRDRMAEARTLDAGSVPRRPDRRAGEAEPASRAARPAWLAAIAAALVVAVVGTALVVGGQRDSQLAARDADLARRADVVAALERVATWSLRITGQPDAEHVELAATDGSAVSGMLVFSPGSRELVVLASGLPQPPAGREFRCWVEVDGERRPVGRMFFADDIQFWVGPVDDVGGLRAGATFGVTLVDAAADSLDGPTILGGAL
jgi:hypothetical protein